MKSTRKTNKIGPKTPKGLMGYMDYAAATPVDSRVLSVMDSVSKGNFASPSSIHGLGVDSMRVLDSSRNQVAGALHAHSDEIIFTSGSTESNNLAILGILKGAASQNKHAHFVTTNIEHSAILEVFRDLEARGFAVSYVEVEEDGVVDPKKIKKALRKDTVLVSVMYANSEIGTIQPIREIAKEIRHFNKINNTKIYLHTDATQAINYLPINVLELGVDLLSFSGIKIYGPRGIGVLFIKRGTPIQKIMFGGDQQFGVRSGSYNLPAIAGLREALSIVEEMKIREVKRLKSLQKLFIKKLNKISEKFLDGKMVFNGDLENRLPNNINITIPSIPSDLLVIELSAKGIAASAKSACKSGDGKASHVIQAINKNLKDTDGSIRFSLGRYSTAEDVENAARALNEILTKLKKWYN